MIQRRFIFATLAVIVLLVGAAGCNTTKQPASSPVSTAVISFSASGQVYKLDCWEVWQDTDNDGTPDQDTFVLHCENITDSNNNFVSAIAAVPWHYSIAITVIRAGQTEEQLVATSLIPGDAVEDFASMTEYDTTRDLGGTKSPDPDPIRGPNFYVAPGSTYPNGAAAVITQANRLYLDSNFFNLGDPNLMLNGLTYSLDLNQGDTVIVRARKQLLSDSGHWIDQAPTQDVELSGSLTVGGVSVPLQGTQTSPGSDGAGVTFSYTKR